MANLSEVETTASSASLVDSDAGGQCSSKQEQLRKVLAPKFAHLLKSYDSSSIEGCRKRPDFVYRAANHHVILECDENGHRSYDSEEEKARMLEIARCSELPVVFVRYNPDVFKTGLGEKKSVHVPPPERETLLINLLERLMEALPPGSEQSGPKVCYLYYDGWRVQNSGAHEASVPAFQDVDTDVHTHPNRIIHAIKRRGPRVAPNKKNGDAGMERLYEHTLQKQMADMKVENATMRAQNADQSAKIDRLEVMMQQLLDRQGAPSNTQQAGELAIQAGDHAQVDNSKKIIINVFGQEKLDHVSAKQIKTILDECLQRPALPTAIGEAVLKTAMLVYSDPDRPENLTAYLPNKKTKDALVHTEAGWEVQPTTLILPPMALKSIDAIFGKQPPEEEYAPLLKELQQNEARFAAGEDLRPILVRNKDLLARALETLPLAGCP